MKAHHAASLALLLVLSGPVLAQAPGASSDRGVSADGARPQDGAIKGGTILPGEKAGIPSDIEQKNRCNDLTGVLRDQCLEQERDRDASGGSTRLPDVAKPPPAREAPPPQNPPVSR